jgi:hypothetical protein
MSLNLVRQEAARVAAHVDLRDVRLFGVSADLEFVPNEDESRLGYRFNADVQIQHSSDEPVLLAFGTYSLNMTAVPWAESEDDAEQSDEDDATALEVASIKFNLNALFELERKPEEPFTEAELAAFGQTTGQFALYPYAREFIADLVGRMGLPALHMGVMRLNLENQDSK